MCGIAGCISQSADVSLLIKKATKAIIHRGPDSEGFYFNNDKSVALGNRRLCVIDRSKSANQPISYANRYHISYNGEVYNYLELREELIKKGYQFSSLSDTEVVLVAYVAYGSECLRHFEGMFAFAIWDEVEKKLFAARDRMGQKPFFYYYDNDKFFFASEMKALWSAGIDKKVNRAMLYNFLTIGYTSNPYEPKETFFENIEKLPEASFITYTLKDHKLGIEKYWQVESIINKQISEDEAKEQLNELLGDAMKTCLRSDVSIGTSLSGGLDSSTIIAYCDGVAQGQYTHQSFTAVFPGFENDEYNYAKVVSERFGIKMHKVSIEEDDVESLMHNAMQHCEEPFTSASSLAQHAVYAAAKKNGITVLLDGQGADELFAGYHKYYKWHWRDLYSKRELKSSNELTSAQELGIKESFDVKDKLAALMPQFAAALVQSQKRIKAGKNGDLNKDFINSNKHDFYYSLPHQFDLNSALYFDSFQYGLNALLQLADRNSMAHGVEVRLPFLNHFLVEFAFSLPPHFKIRNGWTKWLLRKTVENLLPPEITWRKNKIGFEPPQKTWMENNRVKESIIAGKQKLLDQQILSPAVMNKKIQPHSAYTADNRDWKFWSASFLFDA
jgi:asparagine synthase (glutamine-hydrolysing)